MTAPLTTRDILIAARALIARPEAWTKGVLARRFPEAEGQVAPGSVSATCWCAEGAVCRALADAGVTAWDTEYQMAMNRLNNAVPGRPVIHRYNDAPSTTHPMVLAAFDKAIAECAS